MNTLTPFFKEMVEKRWSEFVEMERAGDRHTSSQSVVFAIIRACAKGKLPAIKESLNRIDGKLQEQIEVEFPKFYIVYPEAKAKIRGPKVPVKATPPSPPPAPVTGSLRDTLHRMGEAPASTVDDILEAADRIDATRVLMNHAGGDPLVKSVIVAGLLRLARKGSLGAIFEVFDNIDGKLADRVKILGEDVYITNYSTTAPANAVKNADGVYQVEAGGVTSTWEMGFERARLTGRK